MLSVKPITVVESGSLYTWARFWGAKQRRFFVEEVALRREKQIRDFIYLNDFKQVFFNCDTDVFRDHPRVDSPDQADLVVITDQKFSRFPCPILIEKICEQVSLCSNLYLCLNRHYINIDNTWQDPSLSANFNKAIGQWLKTQLPHLEIIDLSLDYLDRGMHFTWVIPDRHFFIRYAKTD